MQTNERLGRQAYLNIMKRSWIGIPILIVVLALQILLFQNMRERGADRLQDLGESEINILTHMIEYSFEEYYTTLNLVLHANEFSAYLGSASPEDRDQAARMFQRVSRNTPEIRGMSYIDATGSELIRIESPDSEAVIIGDADLGDKSDSECVAASLGLLADEIFYSSLMYRKEDPVRIEPEEFVMKISRPVYREGEAEGIIMISFAADKILDMFDANLTQVSSELRFGLVDSDGRWLLRQEGEGFTILVDQEQRISIDLPGDADRPNGPHLLAGSDLDGSMFLVSEVNPLKDLAHVVRPSDWFVVCAFSEDPSSLMQVLPVLVYIFFFLLFVLWVDWNRRNYLHDNDRQLLRVTSEVADHTHDGVVITDRDTKVQFVNRSFGRIFGFEPEDLEGTDLIDLVQGEAAQMIASEDSQVTYEPFWIRTSSGDSSLSHVSLSGVFDRYEQENSHIISLFHQIPSYELSLESLILDAGNMNLDASDSYPIQRIQDLLGDGPLRCLLLRFSEVDILHALELLFTVSRVNPSKTSLFRYSYDQLLIPVREGDLEGLLLGISSIEAEQAEITGDPVHFFCGISQRIQSEEEVSDALFQARVASLVAHTEGLPVRYFLQEEVDSLKQRYRCRSIFPQALEDGELFLVFQPQVSTDSQRIIGAESLIRWDRPGEGSISPEEFIPAIEEDRELMGRLCRFLLENTMQLIRTMLHEGLLEDSEDFRVSINLTAEDILDRSLLPYLEELFAKMGVPAFRLGIEITERTVVKNFDAINAMFSRLRAAGVEISIDDFGTGFSSLSYLQKLSIDWIKIDRSFIREYPDTDDGILVETLTSMAHKLGKSVICEGVETEDQKRFLGSVGCESYQGYLFSRPLEAESFLRLFAQGQGTGE